MFKSNVLYIYFFIYYQVVCICYFWLCFVAWHHIYFIFAHDLARLFPLFVLGYRRVKTLNLTKHFQCRPGRFSCHHVLWFSPWITSRYLDIWRKKMVSEIKRPPLWKISDPPLRYMYIVVQCGLSSIVECGATIYAVDCVAFSDLVNKCVRPSCSLGALHILRKNGYSPYKVPYLFDET